MGRPKGKSPATLELIATSSRILDEVAPITIRGICYKLFTRGMIPDMLTPSTQRVSRILTAAREDGEIDWTQIVDEQRQVRGISSWSNPQSYIEAVSRSYRKNLWRDQNTTIEVWSEKGTVGGLLSPVLDEFGVDFLVQKGFGSFTSVKEACEYRDGITVLYVGDHDPSGMHMSEVDLPSRIYRYGGNIEIIRIALLRDDCDDLPSFSADEKAKDPRYPWYTENHGYECWELDAMDPNDLRERVREEIETRIDHVAWEQAKKTEDVEKETIQTILGNWKDALNN